MNIINKKFRYLLDNVFTITNINDKTNFSNLIQMSSPLEIHVERNNIKNNMETTS